MASVLLTMYPKCGSVGYAAHLFDEMIQRDVVSWNGMIGFYVENVNYDKRLKFFHEMHLVSNQALYLNFQYPTLMWLVSSSAKG